MFSADSDTFALTPMIPKCIYKYGGINLTKSLVKLFNNMWDSRDVPQEFNGVCRPDESFRHDQQRWFSYYERLAALTCLIVDIIQSFHEGMVARVQDQGQTSEPFSVTNGTKQGCVMAPLLFTLVFSAMLNDAFHDNDFRITHSVPN